jgi:hypothetical protein
MPYSSDEGKDWLRERIGEALRYQPPPGPWPVVEGVMQIPGPRVLDIGAGSGAYVDLVRRASTLIPHVTGIEIYEPYVEMFGLRGRYDEVMVADVREIELPSAEVAILGDVLEHMPLDEAVCVWEKAIAAAHTAVFLSLPIVPWPQGPQFGNEHETHVETWSHSKVVTTLPGITRWATTPTIGVYEAWVAE